MVFSYNWIQSFFKAKLPKPEKLAGLLTMHSFEAEVVKSSVIGHQSSVVLDIDILPNRMPDCASHMGIARECAAILDLRFKIKDLRLKEDKNKKTKDFVTVEVQNKNDCPRYMAKVVTDVKIGPSPKWMQGRLEACGLRPINNIVDVANYVMLEVGQPLHAFDFEKIESVKIQNPKSKIQNPKLKTKKFIVRRARKGEKITTLDDITYDLDENTLIIADSKYPLAIAGIKGGKKAEIDEKTKTIVLESANFNSVVIRRGSQKLSLKTDASLRFEHGLDLNLAELAINRVVELIAELAKGKIAQGAADFYPKKAASRRIKLNLDYARRVLGVDISAQEIKKILNRLGLVETRFQPKSLVETWFQVPSWRLDINLPEDLVEEIGRLYGYEKIPASFPSAALIPSKRNDDIFWEDKARDILKELGMSEVYNYSFVSEKDMGILGYGTKELSEVENPASQEQKYFRPSLISNLLKDVEKNQRSFPEIKIFELGKVFHKAKELRMLTGVITGIVGSGPAMEGGFYAAKGIVDRLLQGFGISDIWYDEHKPTPELSHFEIWQKGRSSEIKSSGAELGFLGEIASGIRGKLSIAQPVAVFDLDFEKLQKLAQEEYIYRPVSKYPAAVRDIAVLVPPRTKVAELLNAINAAGGKLVRDVDLFDIYEGEEVPDGKKNLAFHIVYQADDHTLTQIEIEEAYNKIVAALEKNPNWEVRK